MLRAGSFTGDLRDLRQTIPVRKRERPEREGPEASPRALPGGRGAASPSPGVTVPSAPAPNATISFEGLDYATWGSGFPPDVNGDVGPNHYIQTVNTSVGIFNKTGVLLAGFTFDTLMSQGNFGNLCDDGNSSDPIVVYDTFEDRWILTDFAWPNSSALDHLQCFAVSKTGDPVAGGWNFYSIVTPGGQGDYPKFGVWPDGLYMSVNMFTYTPGQVVFPRLYAFNKAQMYAGAAAIQVISFDLPLDEWTLLPSNARLQTGTPPLGSPNYFTSVWNYLDAVTVWKFHADWNLLGASTLTGPINVETGSAFALYTDAWGRVSSPANSLDTLWPKLMMQNQYSRIAGIESLWNSHTVGASGASSAQASIRYYQIGVSFGTVAATATQAYTYSPADTLHRFMPSAAVNKNGDLAIGYNTANASSFPALAYAGRLAGDPINVITLSETVLIQGGGVQSGNCGGGPCHRWGDYAAMTLDPDGCTFWLTGEYYQVSGMNWNTRVGAFSFPGCTPGTTGTLTGTVKNISNVPLAGATVTLGMRATTTDANGVYLFTGLPTGGYPNLTAGLQGYESTTFTNSFINGGATTTRNLTLLPSVASGCFVDTAQSDFQAYFSSTCDVNTSPGSVTLPVNAYILDQQNNSTSNDPIAVTTTTWRGQTFVPSVTGKLTRADIELACSGCSGAMPDLTVSVRATNGTVPTGSDLATATITGSTSAAAQYRAATFTSPPTLTAGTTYALIIRVNSVPSVGTYYLWNKATNPYAAGQAVMSANSGASWTGDATADIRFKTYMSGFIGAGTFVSSLKDANPAAGMAAKWGSISWTSSVPAGATLKFQVAASNDANGPFTFVGPDNTSNTYFANGGSLAQFTGQRYLRYTALFTSSGTLTPSLNDVKVCFSDYPIGSVLAESFDLINAPSLPPGWTTSTLSGAANLWTTTAAADAGPNGVFAGDPAVVSDNVLVSPLIAMPLGRTALSFRNSYATETGYDGGVLEISIAGAPYADIVAAGGSFVSGGYNFSIISAFFGSPIAGRAAWTGDSEGFITSVVNMPPAAAGKNIQLRWRIASDNSTSSTGWIIDTIALTSVPGRPSFIDLNGDDRGDAFLYDPATGDWQRQVTIPNGSFTTATGSWAPGWAIAPAYFDSDALTDFFLFNSVSGQWAKMLNDGTGFTVQSTGGWWPGWQRYVMDLDGDGISDVFLYDPATGAWFKAVSTVSGFTYYQGGWNPNWEITPMTLNVDALGDMFLINRTTGRWFWVLGQTGAGFTYPATETWFPSWNFYPGDFNGDGVTDMLLHDPNTGTYFVAMNNGAGFTYAQGGWSLGWTPHVADFNADGAEDLFLHDPATGVWFEMISNLAGNFSNAGGQTWSLGWTVSVTDLNGDERADILLYHPASGVWYQARNTSLGSFTYTSGVWIPGQSLIIGWPGR